MKTIILIALVSISMVSAYDRSKVTAYAKKYWSTPNHKCGTYSSCTPFSYWGGEACGYGSHGGDCANFVSQAVLAGGHAKLKGGACRGYPCGNEEIGARNLGVCLRDTFGWKSTCGYQQKPPSNIAAGDVLVYHAGSCDSYDAHAVVVLTGGSNPTIACHSNKKYGVSYTYMGTSKPYYQWLHHP